MMRSLLVLIILCIVGPAYALSPRKDYKHIPSEYEMEYEEFQVVTADSAVLNGWYFTPTSLTGRLVLICHNGEGNMSDYIDRVDFFINMQYTVVTFDYRGFGNSSAFAIDRNQYIYPEFIDDVKAMINFSRQYSTYPVVLYGWGIGGGLALSVGYQDDAVGQIISDTPFLTLKGINSEFKKHGIDVTMPKNFPPEYESYNTFDRTPAKKLHRILLIVPDHFGVYDLKDMALLEYKRPTLVEIATLPSKLWNDPYAENPSGYIERIDQFLDDNY